MKNHNSKIIASIIITVIIVIYYIIYFAVLLVTIPGIVGKLLLGIIPLLLAGAMIYVCLQRIDEIRSGEEDDLSKY